MLNHNSNHVKYYGGSGNPGAMTTTSAIPYGEWTHIAMTRDGTAHKIYVNGTVDATATATAGNIQGCHMRIGGIAPSSESFPGAVAEVSMWSRALTATEIGKLAGTNIKNEMIFEETDTGKSYIWNTTSRNWTEIT